MHTQGTECFNRQHHVYCLNQRVTDIDHNFVLLAHILNDLMIHICTVYHVLMNQQYRILHHYFSIKVYDTVSLSVQKNTTRVKLVRKQGHVLVNFFSLHLSKLYLVAKRARNDRESASSVDEELSYLDLDTGKVLSARRAGDKVTMTNTNFDLIVSKLSTLEKCQTNQTPQKQSSQN